MEQSSARLPANARRAAPLLDRFFESRADVERRRPPQIAPVGLIMRTAGIHRAAVITDDEIADPPFVAVDKFGPGRVRIEVVEQDAALRHRPADDARGVRRKIERFALRAGMAPHLMVEWRRRLDVIGSTDLARITYRVLKLISKQDHADRSRK